MQHVDEKVDMGNFTTIEIDDMGQLLITFDDGDLMFEIDLNARQLMEHLREFFDE